MMLQSPFHVDARCLSLFRVLLGAIVACEALWFLVGDRNDALLSDKGVLPLRTLHSCGMLPGLAALWSLHAGSASDVILHLLLVAQCILGCALAVGIQPRASALGCWALVTSTTNRNPMASHSGDALLRIELLLAALVPSYPRRGIVHDPATVVLLAQPSLMYFFAGALKCSQSWQAEHIAVHYALHIDMAAKPAAVALRSQRQLMRLASLLTPHVEKWTPLLLLCPISSLQESSRGLALAILSAMQASFFCCMVLGNFPFISTVALLPFAPASAWERCPTAGRILDCVAHWGSSDTVPTEPQHASASSLVRSGPSSPRPRACTRLYTRLRGALLLLIGSWVLVWNVEHHCSLLARLGHSPAAAGLAGTCGSGLRVPSWAGWFGECLGLYQSWTLFAPEPNREDGYWVLVGELPSGEYIDAHTGGWLSFDKPALPSAWYGGSHWLQYYLRVWEEAQKPPGLQCTAIYSSLVQWHCKQHVGVQLERVGLVFMHRRTLPPGPNQSAPTHHPTRRVEVWQEECQPLHQLGESSADLDEVTEL